MNNLRAQLRICTRNETDTSLLLTIEVNFAIMIIMYHGFVCSLYNDYIIYSEHNIIQFL